MSRSNLPLKYRVRYEGLVQTFDRRPLKEIESDPVDSPIRRMVAITLSRFRIGQGKKPPEVKKP
jgi:hypothetical protein